MYIYALYISIRTYNVFQVQETYTSTLKNTMQLLVSFYSQSPRLDYNSASFK